MSTLRLISISPGLLPMSSKEKKNKMGFGRFFKKLVEFWRLLLHKIIPAGEKEVRAV